MRAPLWVEAKDTRAVFGDPETIKRLEAMTDFVAFEKLCCDLLAGYGQYQGIVPQGIGRIDGGKDAVLVVRDTNSVSAIRQRVVFHFSLREHYRRKLWEDLTTVRTRKLNADLVVFVTNRKVTPREKDAIKADAAQEFGLDVEVHDQDWLRVPLDGEFQRLRKQYLGIDYDPRVFHDLESVLDVPERHPNRADLEAGAYYRNDPLHERIHGLLDTQRRCLVVGKPGHGKTALAKAIGWELLSGDVRHAVFYVSANTIRSCERWLYHIKAFDHDWVTFILDDCHLAPEQLRALLDAWADVRKARLLLVSRPLDASVAGPAEEDFQDTLEAVQVRVGEPDETTIGRILERILKRDQLAGRDPGPLDRVVARCRGDLHILEFLVRVWLEQPTDVPLGEVGEDRILEAVYARYLGGERREPFRQHIAAIAALSQFEIPVESRWLRDERAVALLKADAYVEVVIGQVGRAPREFLRYFHSTPARYVVRAAYQQGILTASSVDAYVFDRLAGYLRSLPDNFLEVFPQLHRNERDDLQFALFADGSMMEVIAWFIGSVRVPPSAEWLGDFARLAYAVWRWEGDAGPVARRLVQEFRDGVVKVQRRALFGSLDPGRVVLCLLTMQKVDPELVGELTGALDYTELGRCSRALRLGTVNSFLQLARQAGVSKENLNAFCDGLDFRGLGERSRSVRPTTVRMFLQLARQAGVSKENLNAFCDGLDFRGLGERSRAVGLGTVMNFLRLAFQAGVSAAILNAFCDGLDWRLLGRELSSTVNQTPHLFAFHTVSSTPGITTNMAQEFVEGIGWDAVRSMLNAPNAPDILGALRTLLVQRCGHDEQALARQNVVFDSEVWLRSFMERACAEVAPAQRPIQSRYLKEALKALVELPLAPLVERLRGRGLDLKNWNILIHNFKIADPALFRAELEPLLRDMPQAEMTRLLRDADMMNLGVLTRCFAPDTGDFNWKSRLDPDLGTLDFDAKVRPAPLIAIAHPLFTLRFLGKPECCAALADALDRDPRRVLEKLAGADLRTLEFFLWNLLMARDDLRAPLLLDEPEIRVAIIGIARGASADQENLVALCGTLYLWARSEFGDLLPLVVTQSAIRHCASAAGARSPKLIRLAAGLAALQPGAIPARDHDMIQHGLAGLRFPLEVPSQTLALDRTRLWIEAIPPR